MELTAAAMWLDTAFAGFDEAIFSALHRLAEATGGNLNVVFDGISMFAAKGIGMALLALILVLLKKTRKAGLTAVIAFLIGGLITVVIVKNLVARPRPYARADELFKNWWIFSGSSTESQFSFPSGHATITMSVLSAIFFATDHRKSWVLFIFVFLMCVARCYLFVHYPTDVIAGAAVGLFAGAVANRIVNRLYEKAENKPDTRFHQFLLAGAEKQESK